jgi:uncharacterized damage-inducible protein DinB
MLSKIILELYNRDLPRLAAEIAAYPTESAIWVVPAGISNSAGNLCLHLVGNLNHFIGATLGNTGYVRHRELEFSDKNVPREKLLTAVEQTKVMINEVVNQLTPADFEKNFPLEINGSIISTSFMLTHLVTHLSYHLGQINYHRRLVGMQ